MTDAAKPAQTKQDIWVVYDGDCPFCARYVQLMRLRDTLNVHIVNARDDSDIKKEITAQGFNLDRGMAVKYGGTIYHAEQAVTLLSALSSQSGLMNRFMAAAFKSPTRAKHLYPVLAGLRRAIVHALGRGDIDNLTRGNRPKPPDYPVI